MTIELKAEILAELARLRGLPRADVLELRSRWEAQYIWRRLDHGSVPEVLAVMAEQAAKVWGQA